MTRILTGLRSNNQLHLGNYLGAIKPMVDLQNKMEAGDQLFMFVPDLHSFTVPVDHANLYQASLDNAKLFLAAGLDSNHADTFLYRQSHVPAHSEMMVILQNFAYFGELSRMVEFKDKSEKLGHKAVSTGLFNYPVLMAADILLYDAEYVPVGDDQKQHMEMTRTLAQRMNSKFNDLFTVPKPWKDQLDFSGRQDAARIMSLKNPASKMSKSEDDPAGTISLTDSLDDIHKKIMSAETDSLGSISYNPDDQPGISNLQNILSLVSATPLDETKEQWNGSVKYGDFKAAVADAVVELIGNIQSSLASITDDDVEAVLKRGEETAREIAGIKLESVQKALGLFR